MVEPKSLYSWIAELAPEFLDSKNPGDEFGTGDVVDYVISNIPREQLTWGRSSIASAVRLQLKSCKQLEEGNLEEHSRVWKKPSVPVPVLKENGAKKPEGYVCPVPAPSLKKEPSPEWKKVTEASVELEKTQAAETLAPKVEPAFSQVVMNGVIQPVPPIIKKEVPTPAPVTPVIPPTPTEGTGGVASERPRYLPLTVPPAAPHQRDPYEQMAEASAKVVKVRANLPGAERACKSAEETYLLCKMDLESLHSTYAQAKKDLDEAIKAIQG